MTRTALLACFFILSWVGTSRADAVSPDVFACGGRSLANSCKTENGKSGVCQESTCYQKDMAHWDRDASACPPSTPVSCLECVPKDSSGCSVGGARVIAPWLLAGVFAAGVMLLRRRPR